MGFGHLNGIGMKILESQEISEPDAVRCGCTEHGIPRSGVYTRELREYVEFRQGKLLRTWRETVDLFERCLEA
jgi:hypothetical protein